MNNWAYQANGSISTFDIQAQKKSDFRRAEISIAIVFYCIQYSSAFVCVACEYIGCGECAYKFLRLDSNMCSFATCAVCGCSRTIYETDYPYGFAVLYMPIVHVFPQSGGRAKGSAGVCRALKHLRAAQRMYLDRTIFTEHPLTRITKS